MLKPIIPIVAILAFFGCREKAETTRPIVKNITETVYASGIVKSNDQYNFTATVSGTISNVFVKEGDTVKKGQPILAITNAAPSIMTDNAALDASFNNLGQNQARIDELNVGIATARSKMQFDSTMAARQANLWAQGIGTKAELDQKNLAFKNSGNNYRSAHLQLENFKRQLNYNAQRSQNNLRLSKQQSNDYTVRSDINGRVYQLIKKKGEMVTPQMQLGVIGNAGNYYIELQVDESDILRIVPGQKVALTLESNVAHVFNAVVKTIKPIMNPQTKAFTVEAVFTDELMPVLYPNLTLEANIVTQAKNNSVLIPRSFLVNDSTVLLANGEEQKFEPGLRDYEYVEVLSGLQLSDEIMKPTK